MATTSEAVREVCAEIKDESVSHHRDYFDNREVGLLADRILSAYEK